MYIYVTGGDELISLKDLPPLLGLFEVDAAWRWNNRVITCNNVSEDSLQQAKVILRTYGYRRKKVDERMLERYFAEGDKNLLLSKNGKATLTVIPEDQRLSRRRKGTEKTPVEKTCTEAEFTTVLHKLEAAHKKGMLKEDVYTQEREIVEEKLKACRKEKKRTAKEEEARETYPALSSSTLLSGETEASLKDEANKFLLKKLRDRLKEMSRSPAN